LRELILLTIIIISACTSSKDEGVKKINTEEMAALIASDQNIQIVDLRTPGEIAQGFIAKSVFINFSEGNLEEKFGALDKEKSLVIYCASGGRSGKASSIIEKLDFKSMYDYTDGFNGWKTKGLPISQQ
jgi:rhodanese-related sulfurtransferase